MVNVEFSQVALDESNVDSLISSADVRIGYKDNLPGSYPGYNVTGITYSWEETGSTGANKDVWLSPGLSEMTPTNATVDTMSPWKMTFVHEILHALGVDHFSGQLNNLQYTIMVDEVSTATYHPSFRDSGLLPSSLMLYDILALESIFSAQGLNYATRSDDTTYTWGGSEKILYTIWDGGGTDEIAAEDHSNMVIIDLRQGEYSSFGAADSGLGVGPGNKTAKDNIAIAYGTVIENAYGGDGDDILIGNVEHNHLKGGGGNDKLFGMG